MTPTLSTSQGRRTPSKSAEKKVAPLVRQMPTTRIVSAPSRQLCDFAQAGECVGKLKVSQLVTQLLCAKDNEVVEYALARTSSPTLVAEYQTVLPPKELLRRKLHELYAQLSSEEAPATSPKQLVRHSYKFAERVGGGSRRRKKR